VIQLIFNFMETAHEPALTETKFGTVKYCNKFAGSIHNGSLLH
jgi:hypothetical protein